MKKIAGKVLACVMMALLLAGLLPVRAEAVQVNINVGVKAKNPPYQFVENGQVTGLHIDLMDRIGQQTGMDITYKVYDTSVEAEQALQDGEVDVVLGVLPGNCPSYATLTDPISSGTVSLIARNELAEQISGNTDSVEGFTATMELGTVSFSQIGQLKNAHGMFVTGDQMQLFRSVTQSNVDVAIAVKESFLYQLHATDDQRLINSYTVVNNYMAAVEYALMVRKSDVMLCQRLNSGITGLRNSGEYDSILTHWITDVDLAAAEQRVANMLKIIAVLLLAAVGVFAMLNIWNRRLKQLVQEKTEEIRLQMLQLETSSRLRSLLISAFPNSIVLLRENGSVLSMNPRAEQVTGREGTDWANLPEDVNIASLAVFGEIWNATKDTFPLEMESSKVIPVEQKDGSVSQYRYQYFLLNSQNDSALFAEDVTMEEKHRWALFEENKNAMLNRLIAGIAHEIKNPLMAIQSFASIIREQGNDEDFQESFATYVPTEVDRINRLVESLINYAKPVKGTKELVDVQSLTKECLYLVSASVKNKDLQLSCQDDMNAHILVNRDQIKQALLNLLINSVESVAERRRGGEEKPLSIAVRITEEGEYVTLAVYDEGVGMSEESIRHCTEPFYTTKATGTGMGLSLAKQFVAENGGEFSISSELGVYTQIELRFRKEKEENDL